MKKRGSLSEIQKVGQGSEGGYTGKEIRPAIEVKVNGTTVPASKYDVSYFNNKNRGTEKVFINGRDGAFGSRSSTFRIGAMSLADMLKALGLR